MTSPELLFRFIALRCTHQHPTKCMTQDERPIRNVCYSREGEFCVLPSSAATEFVNITNITNALLPFPPNTNGPMAEVQGPVVDMTRHNFMLHLSYESSVLIAM